MRHFKVLAVIAAVFASAQAHAQMPPPDTEGPPIHFRADLNADEESAVTESPGKGVAEFTLDRKTLRFSWKLTFSNLTSEPIGAAVRGPQTVGGEAGVQVDLAPNGFKKMPVEGSVILTDGQLEYLTTDRFYVNVLTKKYPAGEIRGQVNKQRAPKPQVTQ